MIKKKVQKNVVLSAAELEYLATALKEEIMNLRGQIIKSGATYIYSQNKKMLNYIKNEEYTLEGQEVEGGNTTSETTETPKLSDTSNTSSFTSNIISLGVGDRQPGESQGVAGFSKTRGDLMKRKRMSIVNLDEEQFILKYCELKAKFDNLQEAAIRKISEIQNNPSQQNQANDLIDAMRDDATKTIYENDQSNNQELNELRNKIDKDREEFIKREEEYNKKISLYESEQVKIQDELANTKKELDGVQEFLGLMQDDNTAISDKLEKKRRKYKNIKEKVVQMTSAKEDKGKEFEIVLEELDKLRLEKIEHEKNTSNLKTHNELLNSQVNTMNEILEKKSSEGESNAVLETKLKTEELKSKLLEDINQKLLEENSLVKKEIVEFNSKERNNLEQILTLNQSLEEKIKEVKDLQEELKEKDEKMHNHVENLHQKEELERLRLENS